ncbi:hypothetical protein GH714_012939 [Hevea brasiliensis]|uniref:RNase H type-1 domain-containing protein n=1 Tax=Hevea brasiliensis TaxID=3981 RepID=A0A6A6MB53_HEVBR|nr:hypothetical protein GH714_012939 [Hevea brasiliensis]
MLLEKVGGVARPDQYLHAFQEVLSDTGLMDMGYKGYPLTWDNGRLGDEFVEERWEVIAMQRSYQLRFESMWTREEACREIVHSSWDHMAGGDVGEVWFAKVAGCTKSLSDWSKLFWKFKASEKGYYCGFRTGPELEDHVLQLFKGLFASETRGVGEIDLDFAPFLSVPYVLLKNLLFTYVVTGHRAGALNSEFQQTRRGEGDALRPSGRSHTSSWAPRPQGIVRLNTDVAIVSPNMVQLGVVFRDASGLFLAAASNSMCGSWGPAVSEAMAISYGLQLAVDLSFRSLLVESVVCMRCNCFSQDRL